MTEPIASRQLPLLRRRARHAAPHAAALHRRSRAAARRAPGRSRATCRARSCARWARSACSACAMRPNTAARASIRSPTPCWPRSSGRSTYGGFAVTVLVHTDMASPHLYHAGTRAQLERWMPDITAGRKITAVAMTEPDAGSDLASMRTTARKVSGGYVLNGAKMFITNGVHGDLVLRRRQVRRGRPQPSADDVRGREGHAGLPRRARAQEARLALERHGRAGVRGLLRAGRERAGRGGAGLLRAGQEPAERAHRARPRRRWARP